METAVIHEVVKELPLSLEVGASVAQESLDSMGLAVVDIGALVTEAKEHASFEEITESKVGWGAFLTNLSIYAEAFSSMAEENSCNIKRQK